eukprot:TRINITY_DN17102_c0_g1_i1.p1 TRINITY_DN17102_c0_g1~~TRINITY_DN17102_c0_g1_i1.p1  ORF type:complete len:216 (-),score=33.71 TRINITY_DN17102_c0_g1_i1:183-830(-)
MLSLYTPLSNKVGFAPFQNKIKEVEIARQTTKYTILKKEQKQLKRQVNVQASSETQVGSDGRHAILHDFCMMIPYGLIAALCGLISLLFQGGEAALIVTGCGVGVLLMSFASLAVWRRGESSIPYTLITTLLAGLVSWKMWIRVQYHMAWLPSLLMMILSASAGLFGFYNIVAGGNPPKKEPSGEEEVSEDEENADDVVMDEEETESSKTGTQSS